jgi:signal transduction histidine kinase/Na+/proline symporter
MLAPGTLVALTVGYLGVLFAVASLVDRGHGRRWVRHPMMTALALGVYATSWTFFGSVGFAATGGWRFIAVYVGATISCALVPIVWAPLNRIVRERQLASLADLFAYRYQSRGVGALVTLFLLAGSLPYQALQLLATVEAVTALGGEGTRWLIALATTGFLVVFGVVYGVRHLSPRDRHDGFVTAVALESIVKLVALTAAGVYALYGVLGGPSGLDAWLTSHPDALERLARPAREHSSVALLLLAASAVFLLPRQWQMGFTEGDERGLRTASWALPIYLLVLNLAVPLVLWAGRSLGLGGSPEFYVLGIARASGSTALAALIFLGALSASAAMIVVTTVALAGMVQNHVVVPLTGIAPRDLYRRLRWTRRALVAGIILAGYGMFVILGRQPRLVDLGLVSFVAVAQLVPGLVGVLVWPRATARGFAAGLACGMVAWIATPVVPILAASGVLPSHWDWTAALPLDGDPWTFTTALTLGVNSVAFVLGSLWRAPTTAEQDAAETCRRGGATSAAAPVEASTPGEFAVRLAPVLGESAAAAEVKAACADLGLDEGERSPERLRALRDRVEQNLSGLVGPVTARMIVDERLTVDESLRGLVSAQLRYVDERLAAARLEGPARALELARRFLHGVLEDLPLGVCALGPAGDVALWNVAMAELSGTAAAAARGRRLADVGEPWGSALGEFVAGGAPVAEVSLREGGSARSLVLRRATLDAPPPASEAGVVILVEDRTEQHRLEARIAHQERLASIGRLAAGVSHEIGNPLTAIASLAQNLKGDVSDPDVVERIGLIVDQTQRIDRIVRALIGFSRAGEARGGAPITFAPVSLSEVVTDAVTLVGLSRTGRAITFETRVPSDLVVRGDRQRLEQVVVNLLTNASDASRPGARVRVEADREDGRALLRVIDRGAGMPGTVRERIFEPFFTTKEPGEGTGLGLTLVYGIVVAHGGSIDVRSSPGDGTTVTVELPAGGGA